MSSLPPRRASQRSDHEDVEHQGRPRSFSRSSTSKISSADFIITVSPRNADLPPGKGLFCCPASLGPGPGIMQLSII